MWDNSYRYSELAVHGTIHSGGYWVSIDETDVVLPKGTFVTFTQLLWALLLKPGGLATLADFKLTTLDREVLYQRISRLRRLFNDTSAGLGDEIIVNHERLCRYRLHLPAENVRIAREVASFCPPEVVNIVEEMTGLPAIGSTGQR